MTGEDMNKWCVRECERSEVFEPGVPIVLRDYSRRRYNCHDRQQAADREARQS